MTKKHFEAIAEVIDAAANQYRGHDPVAVAVVEDVAQMLAARFFGFNPAFDKARFLKACGVGE